jgi:hypothetical protein
VLVATKPVDFRRGADSLAALVREQLRHDPFSGTIYIFRSKRAAGYMAAPERFAETSDSFSLHRGRRPYMARSRGSLRRSK